jgi:hypothetical protein
VASHTDYQIGGQGWLHSLPVGGSPDDPTSRALFTSFGAVLDFARLKGELAPDDERLLVVLKAPEAATGTPASLLFALTRWEQSMLAALLVRFGKVSADLGHLETFRRVFDASAWVTMLGISASALITATTNEPTAGTVRDLQAALRARYAESDWLNVTKPINDQLRGLQRDALVAYILHQMRANPTSAHINTPDKLFEYFLMDVQMEPCMQTSRIRHALSSVQLFIERCLMNLEPRVASSAINAKQWEWMKRYRVWEANRKVFLWPENWLEPELRDDQSPFFKETMSELLQSDITEDRAAVALLNYLSKLDEVAKLEPCGIHYVENDPGTADDIAHVVARTAGASRKYYYRRREYGYWTPWEHMKLDIEDNPVIPVVWKNRLFVFWLRILKQTPTDQKKPVVPPDVDLAKVKVSQVNATPPLVTMQALLCWSEYSNGKWQPTKTSDVNNPVTLGQYRLTDFDRSKLMLSVSIEDGALRVTMRNQGRGSFLLYNIHSLPIRGEDMPITLGPSSGHQRHLSTLDDVLAISYDKFQPGVGMAPAFSHDVLKSPVYGDHTIAPGHPLKNPWEGPFFYEDRRHVFFVTITDKVVRISSYQGYGGGTFKHLGYIPRIPPVVLQTKFRVTDRIGPMSIEQHHGISNLAPIERFVSEDAYIRQALGTIGVVRFGDKEFGPAGALIKLL